MEVGGNEEACQKGAGGAGKQVAGFQEGREKERERVCKGVWASGDLFSRSMAVG